MRQNSRIDEVDVLRGLAALLMILGHSFIVYPVDISGIPWCKAVQHFIYTFHMELFFVLAGVVYQCKDYKEYINKKIKRILIPYLFFGFAAVLGRAFGGFLVNGIESFGKGMVKLLLHGGGYWFLYVSFLLFVIYPPMERVFNTRWKKIVFTLAFLVLSEASVLPKIFMMDTLAYYIPYFILGDCAKTNICSGGGIIDKRRFVLECVP